MESLVGREAVVRVATATLWAAPDAVRPVDAAALAAPTDVAGWVAALDHGQRMGEGVLSQLLLGERVAVESVRDDGWAEVVAVEQAADGRDPRGYPGWLPVAHLAAVDAAATPEPTLVVDAVSTTLRDAPAGRPVLSGIVLGTRLAPAGAPWDGWQPVRSPGHPEPLWVPEVDLAAPPERFPAVADVLATARLLTDVPYVWGGVSAYGIDCSGLVHLAWRRHGVRLPRDAADQAGATVPLALGEERPGDLYFFARPGRRIHHVGLVVAAPDEDRRMLHACYTNRRVIEEVMPQARVDTLVGAHRVASV